MEIIATEMLEKNYGDVRALNGLNLRVLSGIFGFIGVNGAGKTTTIKILVGALRPDGGEAHVLGNDSGLAFILSGAVLGVIALISFLRSKFLLEAPRNRVISRFKFSGFLSPLNFLVWGL